MPSVPYYGTPSARCAPAQSRGGGAGMTQVAVVMNDSKCSTYIVCLGADKEEPCPKGALAVAVVDLVLSIISFALLLCVLLALKKEAWNSPVKRLCILLASFLGLQELLYASVGFCCGILPHELCVAVKFILLFLDTTVVLRWYCLCF